MRLDRFKSLIARLKGTKTAYHRVFTSPEGEIVLRDLLKRGGLLQVSAVAGDPHMTHYNDGRRSIVLEIVHQLRWSEGEMMQLALQRTGEQLADTTGED